MNAPDKIGTYRFGKSPGKRVCWDIPTRMF